jgi:hypothetical protein
MVELYLNSPLHLHGMVLNYLAKEQFHLFECDKILSALSSQVETLGSNPGEIRGEVSDTEE